MLLEMVSLCEMVFQRPSTPNKHLGLCERLQVAGQAALGPPGASGHCPDFAEIGSVEGDDPVSFADGLVLEDYPLCFVEFQTVHECPRRRDGVRRKSRVGLPVYASDPVSPAEEGLGLQDIS